MTKSYCLANRVLAMIIRSTNKQSAIKNWVIEVWHDIKQTNKQTKCITETKLHFVLYINIHEWGKKGQKDFYYLLWKDDNVQESDQITSCQGNVFSVLLWIQGLLYLIASAAALHP